MKTKEIAIGLVMIVTSFNIYAQDYFIVRKDTTFCSKLNYSTTAQGYLKSIEYTDVNGKRKSVDGRKNVPDVSTFYQDSISIDKTPLKANRPDSYIRYTERAVDGKLKVYIAQQGYNQGTMSYGPGLNSGSNNNRLESTGGPSGIYRFYLKMPDGTYYKINNKGNMKKFIRPYLLKCTEFKNEYKGDYSAREQPFTDMIRLYNSLCE